MAEPSHVLHLLRFTGVFQILRSVEFFFAYVISSVFVARAEKKILILAVAVLICEKKKSDRSVLRFRLNFNQ